MTVCLIVENSDTIRAIVAEIVESLGVEAVEAKTSTDAAEACAVGNIDVIVLDWDLPKLGAMDFLRTHRATELSALPPVILSVTENDPQQIAIARTAGVSEIIFKPFDAGQIADAFDSLGLAYGAPMQGTPEPKDKPAPRRRTSAAKKAVQK